MALSLAIGAFLASRAPVAALGDWLALPPGVAPSLTSIGAAPRWVWGLTGLLCLLAVLTHLPRSPRPARHWSWRSTGSALGLLGVAAWLLGAMADWRWGLSVTGPARGLVETVASRSIAPIDWGVLMLLGIPLGTWMSARLRGPVRWRGTPHREVARRVFGGLLMGIGGTVAAGCNIGNALTGLSIFSANSVLATAGIVAGGALAIRASSRVGRVNHELVRTARG